MNKTLIITRLTLREALRRKIVLTALILGISFLVIYAVGIYLILRQEAGIGGSQTASELIRNEGINFLLLAGLYTITFLSVAMAALLAADTLAGEINSGTIQSLVTKPIRRSDVVFGKWLGFAILLGVYILLMAGGVVTVIFLETGYTAPNQLAGLGLIYLEALLIMSVSLLCSSRLTALATGAVVFGLYGLAFIGGWVEQFGSILQNQTAIQVGIVTSLIIPSETLWRRAAYDMQSPLSGYLGMSPFGTTSAPSSLSIIYAVIYLVVAVLLALRTFSRRDL